MSAEIKSLVKEVKMQARFVNVLLYGIQRALVDYLGKGAQMLNNDLLTYVGDKIVGVVVEAEAKEGRTLEEAVTPEAIGPFASEVIVKQLELASSVTLESTEKEDGIKSLAFGVKGCAFSTSANELAAEGMKCVLCPTGLVLASIARKGLGEKVRLVIEQKQEESFCNVVVESR